MHFLFHLGFEVPQPCEAQNLNRSTTVAGISHVMHNKTLPCTWRSDHDEGGGDNDNSPDGDSGSHPTTDKNKPQTRSTDHQQLQYSLCSRDPPSRIHGSCKAVSYAIFHQVPLQLSGPAAAPRWTPPGRPLVPHALPAHGVQWQSFQLDMNLEPKWRGGRRFGFWGWLLWECSWHKGLDMRYANDTWTAGPGVWISDCIWFVICFFEAWYIYIRYMKVYIFLKYILAFPQFEDIFDFAKSVVILIHSYAKK